MMKVSGNFWEILNSKLKVFGIFQTTKQEKTILRRFRILLKVTGNFWGILSIIWKTLAFPEQLIGLWQFQQIFRWFKTLLKVSGNFWEILNSQLKVFGIFQTTQQEKKILRRFRILLKVTGNFWGILSRI